MYILYYIYIILYLCLYIYIYIYIYIKTKIKSKVSRELRSKQHIPLEGGPAVCPSKEILWATY